MRLISVCPSNTELLHYLDLSDDLVGVDDYSDWPFQIQSLPRVGPDLNIDLDKVEALKPDLVFASLSVPGMEKNVEQLKERNIPYVIVPNPKTLTEVGDAIQFVANAVNCPERGKELRNKFDSILSQYREIKQGLSTTYNIYWEWWPKPVFTPGRDNWLTEISDLAGGSNVFESQSASSVQTDWEEVRSTNPDVIAICWVGVSKNKINEKNILNRAGWKEISAIKNKQLYILEEPLFCRPSPRLLLGLSKIANLLHPNSYPTYTGKDLLLQND
ncbi:cobalamin-binding protein [Alteribacter aurantiacus]|uniref:cobalamin-binding protein n=1 Tax=Alteribacter aurantiacus TaxID=254410 RepID=UPI00041DFB38|nr:cobalamin-binding protein [Alteribacter aurantiacus]